MFIAVLLPMREFLAASAAADLAVTARVKLAYERAVREQVRSRLWRKQLTFAFEKGGLRGAMADPEYGRNSKLPTAQGLSMFLFSSPRPPRF